MLILITRYAFLLSIMLGGGNGDVYRTKYIDNNIIQTAVCTVKCQQKYYKQQQSTSNSKLFLKPGDKLLPFCYEECRTKSIESDGINREEGETIPNLQQISESLILNLICREDNSLTFRIDSVQSQQRLELQKSIKNGTNVHMQTYDKDTLYIIRIQTANEPQGSLIYLSDESFFTLDQLQSNTTHNITVIAVHSTNEYTVIAKGQQFSTLKHGYKPHNVTSIKLLNFEIDDNNDENSISDIVDKKRLKAKITWKPSNDLTCHYNIIYFSTTVNADLTPIEIRDPRQLYSYELSQLEFDSTYRIGIRAQNPNSSNESDMFWETIYTPSCITWYNNNFSVCAPPVPTNVKVEQTFLAENEYALNITWDYPEFLPDNYTIFIMNLRTGEMYTRNPPKDSNSEFVPNVELSWGMFEVKLEVCTPGGCSSTIVTEYTKTMIFVTDKSTIAKLISLILAPIVCIGILVLTFFMIFHRRAKLKRYQKRCKYFEDLEKEAPAEVKPAFDFTAIKGVHVSLTAEELTQFQLDLEEKILFDDAMEIERDNITLYEILGEGAFGLVRRGLYKCENEHGEPITREVAVKMLKDHPTADEVRAFRREIEVMKSVERHPNIVGIIGHCTQRLCDMMLLTEYCSSGNLLDFLRDEWKFLLESHVKCSYPPHLSKLKHHASADEELQHKELQKNNFNMQEENQSMAHEKLQQHFKMDYDDELTFYNASTTLTGTSTSTKSSTVHQSPTIEEDDYDNDDDGDDTDVTEEAGVNMRLNATDNKCYGYEELCSNACKCQVNVIQNETSERYRAGKTLKATIEIKDCSCPQHTTKSNKGYKLEQKQQQQQQQQAMCVENKEYFKEKSHIMKMEMQQGLNCTTAANQPRVPLSALDLLDIARQVAVGMEFLAKNKVVHRDLAARNVLISPDKTVKIADFGLSRDVYQENIYKKTGNGKLPIKWLALESLTHQVYTTQSDVWSYGILLYEIVTLGGTPYPSIPTNRLLYLLKSGFRMEKPKYCGQELYELMYACWHANPNERPTFAQIIKTLDKLMYEEPQKQIESAKGYLSARLNSKPNKLLEQSSEDPYLKPV